MDPRTIEISRLRARNDYLNATIDALRAERARLAMFGLGDLGAVPLATTYVGASPLRPPPGMRRGIGLVALPMAPLAGAASMWAARLGAFAGIAHGPYTAPGLPFPYVVLF